MGTLAGMALRLREMGQGQLQAINVNDRNRGLLENLGLSQLFKVRSPGDANAPRSPEKQQLEESQPLQPPTTRDTVLSAHQALIAAQSENETRFRDVIEYLKQENPQKFTDF